ncbi:MAG: immune inhibitor A, partial [Bacteriovorax sp.]|nr:immune inhibitor A [Bacteriovorax sp.]
ADSALMQGIFDMYYRNLGGSLAPEENTVKLKFKKANGSVLKITVPWIVKYADSCVNLSPAAEKNKTASKKASKLSEATDVQMFKERKQFFKEMRKNFLSFFKKKSFVLADPSIETADLSTLTPTGHPDLAWKNILWKGQKIGYLQLSSFDAPKGVKAAVDEVKRVLEEKFTDTSAVVVDLRANYGGQIVFAEEMAALFNPRPVRVLPFYIRANDLTLALYDSDMTWKDLILPYAATNTVVGPGSVTTESELLAISQVYFGKVVLLTNSECFSSCDLFSAAMKDNNHATIYGTDRSTMGGGANVWPLQSMQEIFQAAHMPVTLPQGISTRITGRHAHRLSTGALIEDAGVSTDIMVNETDADVVDPDHSSIVAKIFNDLIKIPGHMSSEISLGLDGDEKFIRHGNIPLSLFASPKTVDQIAIYKSSKFIKRVFAGPSNMLNFTLDTPEGKFGQSSFLIYGFSKDAATKFPILRKSIVTESLGDYAPIDSIDAIANAVMVNSQQVEKCNWIKSNDSLVLTGPYCADGRIEAVESLEVSEGAHALSFDMILDTEPTFDFFDITVIADGIENKIEDKIEDKLMIPVSDHTEGRFNFDLSKYAGKKIDIRFRLISDEAGSGKGITISNLKIN